MKSWQSVKRAERMAETLREESKDLQQEADAGGRYRKPVRIAPCKGRGHSKGTAQGVADWFTGKSKRRAKKAEENEAKTKAEASAQIKAIRDKCAAKGKNWRRTR